jgi:hypothetical protein
MSASSADADLKGKRMPAKNDKWRPPAAHPNSQFGHSCTCWFKSIPDDMPLEEFFKKMKEIAALNQYYSGRKDGKIQPAVRTRSGARHYNVAHRTSVPARNAHGANDKS